MQRILDAARWAPSGDNAQPWTFELLGDDEVAVQVFCDPDSVYEYGAGEPTLIAAGMLLENMQIAAKTLGWRMRWDYLGVKGPIHTLHVRLAADEPQPDSLYGAIYQRSVDRRPYQWRALDRTSKNALCNAGGDGFVLEWFESLKARLTIAALISVATDIRLRIPETFEIHRRIVDWNQPLSPRGIPFTELGLDALTLKMMRWSLAKRPRTDFLNRLGSPQMASLQMDLIPAIFSASYFTFRIPKRHPDAHDAALQLFGLGQAVQRFWLTITTLGMVMQPCFAPLAFSYYGRNGVDFTRSESGRRSAQKLASRMEQLFPRAQELAFMGRIGWPRRRHKEGRSTRANLSELIKFL